MRPGPRKDVPKNMNLDQARQFNEHKATAFAAIMDRENRLPKELVPALAEAGLIW